MPFIVTMPKLTPTMEEGHIAKWHVKVGDRVKEGDLLIEVATDKATVEYNALDEGFLRQILVDEGSEAKLNQPIAIFAETMEESIDDALPKEVVQEKVVEEQAPIAEVPTQSKAAMGEPVFAPVPPLEGYKFEFPTGMQNERILASPAAKKIALEKKIDLSSIKGSGPNGRIVTADLDHVEGGEVPFHSRSIPQVAPGSYHHIPLTPMRKTVGKRLQESKTFIPHFYVSDEVVVDELVKTREELKEMGIKITYNDLVLRATALALKQHPTVNSGFDNQENAIIQFDTIDVAVAVSVEGGLITPIVRHTDYKNVTQISQEVKELVTLAKKQKLKPEQYQGGSFTVSNLGMFGITHFSAIINPPQAAILAVGGIIDKAIVKVGKVVPGKVLGLTLSVDHRVIDGAEAAAFLVTLRNYLSRPSTLII